MFFYATETKILEFRVVTPFQADGHMPNQKICSKKKEKKEKKKAKKKKEKKKKKSCLLTVFYCCQIGCATSLELAVCTVDLSRKVPVIKYIKQKL